MYWVALCLKHHIFHLLHDWDLDKEQQVEVLGRVSQKATERMGLGVSHAPPLRCLSSLLFAFGCEAWGPATG